MAFPRGVVVYNLCLAKLEYIETGPTTEFGWTLLKKFDLLVEIDEISWDAIKTANSFRLRRFEPRFSGIFFHFF